MNIKMVNNGKNNMEFFLALIIIGLVGAYLKCTCRDKISTNCPCVDNDGFEYGGCLCKD